MTGDFIGNRGQWLCCLLLTQVCPGRQGPYFQPWFLGDKYPAFDYLVKLIGSESFFFVSVKSTQQGFRKGRSARQLRVNVDSADVQRMVASPVPAYVVGIDEPRRAGYLLSMNEPRQTGLGGLPARHRLNCTNLRRLWQEVEHFWSSRDMVLTGSHFA